MGLFDFVKNIGNKLFSKEAEAAERIQEHIEEDNPGIQGMNVEFNDGVVSISGDAESPEAREKAILMAGNVKGVSEVVAENLNRISKGDIPEPLTQEYQGDFNDIKNNLNRLIENLGQIIGEIRSGTGVLLDSVQNLSVSAQQIASTSNQQAASVKEIVSTMEDSDQLTQSVATRVSEVTSASPSGTPAAIADFVSAGCSDSAVTVSSSSLACCTRSNGGQ